MNQRLLLWDIYEVSSEKSSLHGVMLRGRIRKLGIEKEFNVLVENTEDKSNRVRFAVLTSKDATEIINYLKTILSDLGVELVLKQITNPVLSKLKVNNTSRYNLK